MIPPQVQTWCVENGHGEITSTRPVGGGCINHGARLATTTGETFFLKTNANAPDKMFLRETEGLHALLNKDGPTVPQVYCYGAEYILMEDLAPAAPARDYWASFGRRLAALHEHTQDRFGFEHDNYIGSTMQPNSWNPDGYAFFAHNRLLFQAGLARQRGLLDGQDYNRVESIAKRLADLVPPQPASLIHGDLWSGNAITDRHGQPALIDPAVYFGWGEAELGMTALFGGFPHDFYRAYEEVRPLTPGWQSRLPIYNLYHLLNHVNLFGAGYLSQTRTILQKFA